MTPRAQKYLLPLLFIMAGFLFLFIEGAGYFPSFKISFYALSVLVISLTTMKIYDLDGTNFNTDKNKFIGFVSVYGSLATAYLATIPFQLSIIPLNETYQQNYSNVVGMTAFILMALAIFPWLCFGDLYFDDLMAIVLAAIIASVSMGALLVYGLPTGTSIVPIVITIAAIGLIASGLIVGMTKALEGNE